MKVRFSILATVGVAALAVATLYGQTPASQTPATQTPTTQTPTTQTPTTQQPATERTTGTAAGTTKDGVYTDDQARRGESVYQSECAPCHGPELTGGEMAPPLTGAEFIANWNDMTVGDLFERIRVSMPANNPGSLNRQQNADVVSFMLKFDKYPAGQSELPPQTESLKTIKIVPVQ